MDSWSVITLVGNLFFLAISIHIMSESIIDKISQNPSEITEDDIDKLFGDI